MYKSMNYKNPTYLGLLDKCLSMIDDDADYECYCMAYGPWGYTQWPELAKIPYKSSVVIWLAEDSLSSDHEFNWYKDTKPHGLAGFESICCDWPTKKFILINNHIDLQKYIEVDNLCSVELPPHTWDLHDKYDVTIERLPQTSCWISFMNNCMWNRVAVVSYLLANNLDKHGSLSLSPGFVARCQQFEHIYNFLTYEYDRKTYEHLDLGYQRIISGQYNSLKLPGYRRDQSALYNVTNFQKNLLPQCRSSRLEIVCGSIHDENTPYLGEKELQAIMSCNFIIFITCAGTVRWLRDIGFDVFDDVVNHEYDMVQDPGQRIICALSQNQHLLDGTVDLDLAWHRRRDRFLSNVMHVGKAWQQAEKHILDQFSRACDQSGLRRKDAQ